MIDKNKKKHFSAQKEEKSAYLRLKKIDKRAKMELSFTVTTEHVINFVHVELFEFFASRAEILTRVEFIRVFCH